MELHLKIETFGGYVGGIATAHTMYSKCTGAEVSPTGPWP
jgi:hypothetical protein